MEYRLLRKLHTGKGMPIHQKQEGPESCRLQQGGIQAGGIQTGTGLIIDNLVKGADPLPDK